MPPTRVDGSHFSPDTCSFIELLDEHRVRYLIVGGEAVIFHGHVRVTGDVGFFFDPAPDNVARLHAALSDFWDGSIPGDLTASDLEAEGTVVQFGRPPNRIDLLNSIGVGGFEDAWVHRVQAVLVTAGRELPLPYIGLDSLIESKRAAGRPQDLTDLSFLTRQRRS